MIPAEARVKSRLIVFGWRGNNCIAKGRARVAMLGIALTAKNSNCITRNDGNDLIALTAKIVIASRGGAKFARIQKAPICRALHIGGMCGCIEN